MLTADQIVTLARAYCAATGSTMSALGRRSVNNDKIFNRLSEGHGANVLAVERAYHWLHKNWPEATPWPNGLPRPIEGKFSDGSAARQQSA